MWRHWSCLCYCQNKPAGDLLPVGTMLVSPTVHGSITVYEYDTICIVTLAHAVWAGLRSRMESEVFGWSRSRFFVRHRVRMFNWIIFYIRLLNREFLLKWYNFFWNWEFLLCTTISIDFNSQISFPLCWGVGVGNFGKAESGSGSRKLLERSDILPPTPQPWFWGRSWFPEVQSSVEAGRTDVQIAWPLWVRVFKCLAQTHSNDNTGRCKEWDSSIRDHRF